MCFLYFSPILVNLISNSRELAEKELDKWASQVQIQQCDRSKPFLVAQWIGSEDSPGLHAEAIKNWTLTEDDLDVEDISGDLDFSSEFPDEGKTETKEERAAAKKLRRKLFLRTKHTHKNAMFLCNYELTEKLVGIVLNETVVRWEKYIVKI